MHTTPDQCVREYAYGLDKVEQNCMTHNLVQNGYTRTKYAMAQFMQTYFDFVAHFTQINSILENNERFNLLRNTNREKKTQTHTDIEC